MIKTTAIATLETKRLLLRQWQPSDLALFSQMNADPEVMRYFPKQLSKETSDIIANKCQQLIEDNGWGFWAVALKNTSINSSEEQGKFIGMVGLNKIHADMPFAPGVEIAWRLHKAFWRKGYAFEAAQAALRFAFEGLELNEVAAFTASINKPSQRLMQRLGMSDTYEDFYHPMLDCKHALAKHVRYKITRQDWEQSTVPSI